MKLTIESIDPLEIQSILKSKSMAIAINSLYDEVLRKYVKYIDTTEKESLFINNVIEEIRNHFDGLYIDE